ncbi:hypothetical protein [Paragemmobacter straminiformis]|uniref:Uncharacterized protein n=1 Tax=Paragemmobacter straminiformis TaxID=2045119 RepID=A0A842I5D9_9RHOB|nr:hypothetical protein [Gemmobacter straminiformis]MBC2834577.1 hypothetical protein [Gemmobacter straminiformis]
MAPVLRNLLLSVVLIAVPAGGFTLVETVFLAPAQSPVALSALGDLSAYAAIVADTQKIAATADFAAAERRISDLETLWDRNEPALRPADPAAWASIDDAADAAFAALRTDRPDAAKVQTALGALLSALAAPVAAAASQPVQLVAGIAVTDDTGHALPCEELIGTLRDRLAGKTPPAAVADLQAKALERCNADDDTRANVFSAQALAMVKE